MKLKRLLAQVEALLSAEQRQRKSDREELRKLLDKLKKKERKLGEEAKAESDEEKRAALEVKLRTVHAQRRKGIAVLKAAKPGKGKNKEKHKDEEKSRHRTTPSPEGPGAAERPPAAGRSEQPRSSE